MIQIMPDKPRTFAVDSDGSLSDPSYDPQVRADVYDDYPDPIKTRKDLIYAVDAIPPLCEVLASAYEAGMGCPYTDPVEKEDNWPEVDPWDWDESFFTDWYPLLKAADLKKLSKMISVWLNEEPNWSLEEPHFHLPADSYGIAFDFFQSYVAEDANQQVLHKLGIELIEGFHPGDDSRVAQLSLGPEQANAICIEFNMPMRFKARD